MDSAEPSIESSSRVKDSAGARERDKLINIIEEKDATLACVEDFIKGQKGVVDLNERNKHGRTALMIACLHGKLDIVTYLLDGGANPHLITPGEGNTAFHFACMYTGDEAASALSEETKEAKAGNSGNPASGKDRPKKGLDVPLTLADRTILHISLLLLSHKVETQANHDGLFPLDVAALNKRFLIIAFFGSKDFVVKSEIKRALNILGFTLALDDKCNDAFRFFEKAMLEGQNDPDNPVTVDFTSDLEGFLDQKECQTLRDLKALRKKKHAIKVHAFLVGDRVLPEGMKPKLLYEPLAKYGHKLLFSSKTMAKGFGIFGACLHLERKGLFYLNTVLMYLRMSVPRPEILDNLKEPQFINSTCKTLATYVDVVKDVSCDHLKKSVKDIMCNLGRILFDVVDKYASLETLKRFLTPIGAIINVIWSRIPKPEATGIGIVFPTISVCHNVLLHMGRENCADFFFRRGNFSVGMGKYTSFLFKRLIARLLHIEGALDIDCHGNTMMHTLMIYSQSLVPHMIVEIVNLLIRHGCPTGAKNKEGETPNDIISKETGDSDDDDDDDESHACKMEVLSNLLKGPREMYSLQELAARSILCHRIPYQEKLPSPLFTILQDPILDEEDEERESSNDYDSDGSSEQSFDQNCSIS